MDFDAEARKLFSILKLDQGPRSDYNPMDPIFQDTSTGGTIYVGNQSAASGQTLLAQKKISHIVNCTDDMANYFEESGKIAYYRFNVSFWRRAVNNTHASVHRFCRPLFQFVDDALANGGNVLVHCLAGAHRAGTTGCLLLMYKMGFDQITATKTAASLRPVINPIGHLPELLRRYEMARDTLNGNSRGKLPNSQAQNNQDLASISEKGRDVINSRAAQLRGEIVALEAKLGIVGRGVGAQHLG